MIHTRVARPTEPPDSRNTMLGTTKIPEPITEPMVSMAMARHLKTRFSSVKVAYATLNHAATCTHHGHGCKQTSCQALDAEEPWSP